ncbi:SPRY domain-containing SOCS box protein 3 isoform X2 [Sitodiplosis mosellana]|nr:SPRY domain-containing SOCS box protein 3 isoform X2 [Sitodiplosis mosellana]XP_055316688.1 SPRY domain-containing SOCS box protein 3 isoform X2 [Sitodiplosis mosellana]XP_055316689.1 SPRY domain-containing SOCS box protein 3 isoform X2 [Sitodiplosis mosellana]
MPSQLTDREGARKVYLDPPKGDKTNLQIPPDTCRCGEDACQTINWTWDRQNVQPQTIIQNHTVQFHPIYSQGTSVIRSNQPLTSNMIHYWEVKIVHWLSGTDLMVGIGSDAVNLMEYRYKFASVLGLDNRSWGYSHRGMIQHKNILKYYGKSYTKRCIVGVYLDLSRGHLEFYVNRIPQGIAFRNIPLDKEKLYAMVCSTSAKSSVRLINTTSFRDCLQFRCMKVITKYPQLLDKVQNIPGLANLCRDVWFMFPKERYQYSEKSNDSQQENNLGAQISTESKLDDAELDEHQSMESMEVIDDCDSLPGNIIDSSNEHEDIDEAIFLPTFKEEPQQSSDDDDPVYDDGD